MDRYHSIVERNPFGLKDPPPRPATPQEPKPEPKKDAFFLTGISTIGHPKRPKVFLLSKDASKKDYDQKYYSLTVGDRQGDLTLLDVDTKGQRVRIEYLGEEKWLSMKDNGVPAPTGPASAVARMQNAPGLSHAPAGTAPVPLHAGGGIRAPQAHHSAYPNVSNRRIPRVAGNIYSAGRYAAPQNSASFVPGQSAPAKVPLGPQTDTDLAAQVINLYANHQRAVQNGKVTPPLPPFAVMQQ